MHRCHPYSHNKKPQPSLKRRTRILHGVFEAQACPFWTIFRDMGQRIWDGHVIILFYIIPKDFQAIYTPTENLVQSSKGIYAGFPEHMA